ncbi:hypothetical protein Tco_1242182 [Tanacetum coccineum]
MDDDSEHDDMRYDPSELNEEERDDKTFSGGCIWSTAPGYYQRNNANPSYQERRQSIEDTLRKFMSESVKRHEENSNLIKEIRATTDAAIRNQEVANPKHRNSNRANEQVPLILGRPFLSTARAKIDVYKRKITLRVGKEKIIFKSVKTMLLRRNQGDDLMPTIEEGEVIEEFRTRDEDLDTGINDYK